MIGKDVMLEQEHINVMTVGGAKNSGLGVDAIAVVAARRRGWNASALQERS